MAVGYMFMLARSLYRATATMKNEEWAKKSFSGDEIGGKTLGLIGIGNIGKATARRAAALGMTVVAYDPYVSDLNSASWFHWMSCWPRPTTSACISPKQKKPPI